MENNDDEVVRLRNKTITKFIGQDHGDYITISEMIKTINLFNLQNIISYDEIKKIFDELDLRQQGKVKKSILVANLQNSNTEQGYKLYLALTKNFNSKSEKIIHKLKFLKNHPKIKNELDLVNDISWIITTLADEDIYLPENINLEQNHGNKEMFGLMTNIEINQNKMNDLRKVNGSIDPYKTKSFMNLKNKRQTMLPIKNNVDKGIGLEENFTTVELIRRCDFNLENVSSSSKKSSLFGEFTDLSHMIRYSNCFKQKENPCCENKILTNKLICDNGKDSKSSNNNNLKTNVNPNKKKSEKNLVINVDNEKNTDLSNKKSISPTNKLKNVTKNDVKITSINNENEKSENTEKVKKAKFKDVIKKDDKKNVQSNTIDSTVDTINSIKMNFNLLDLSDEAYEILNLIDDPKFDIFDLDKILNYKTLYYITQTVFKEKKYFDKLIKIETFNNFTNSLSTEGYTRDIPYHNDLHAADVFQTVFVFFSQGEFEEVRV